VTWGERKQTAVAKSTWAAEYMAVSEAMDDRLWLRNLLDETAKAKSGVKSLKLAYHRFKDFVKSGDVEATYVKSEDNFADLFTKFCQGPTYKKFR